MNRTEYKQFLIAEIKRYVKENNEIPTCRKMGRKYPSITAYQHYFGSWNNALEIAGYPSRYKWTSRKRSLILEENIELHGIENNVYNGYISPCTFR